MMNRIILLFTESYPIGGIAEEAFVRPELEFLSRAFDKVYLVPSHIGGEELANWKVAENVELVSSYSEAQITKVSRLRIAIETVLRGMPLSRRIEIRRRLEYMRFSRWMKGFLGKKNSNDILLYTFWLANEGEYVGQYAFEHKLIAISRAHRFDIIDMPQTEFRKRALNGFKRIFPCSNDGCEILHHCYPMLDNRSETSYLGVPMPRCVNPPKLDSQTLVFISCHNLIPRKRGVLCAQVLVRLASEIPGKRIRWILIGDGPDRMAIFDVLKKAPPNLELDYRGAMKNDLVREVYASEPIDFGILLSESEGLAVMVQEALSFGIPVIATDVGGMRECVSDDTGVLLPAAVSMEEWVDKIKQALAKEGVMRQNAVEIFRQKFEGNRNRLSFTQILLNILSGYQDKSVKGSAQ